MERASPIHPMAPRHAEGKTLPRAKVYRFWAPAETDSHERRDGRTCDSAEDSSERQILAVWRAINASMPIRLRQGPAPADWLSFGSRSFALYTSLILAFLQGEVPAHHAKSPQSARHIA